MTTPDLEHLDLSDTYDDDLFASPSRADAKDTDPTADLKVKSTADATDPSWSNPKAPARQQKESDYDSEEARVAMLQRELNGVREINEVIEGVVASLERAKGNMETVSRTVLSASTLLNTWIRILSQTEHNQRLILNPNWQGATQDVQDMENEVVLKQQAVERREAEELQRREAAARRAAEEEQRRRAAEAGRGQRGAGRGTRGRGASRGASAPPASSGTSYVGVGGQGGRGAGRGGSAAGRAESGIGRGLRGRGGGRGLR